MDWSSAVESDNFGITFFGIIKRWVGACGLISLITMDNSSSKIISAGISLSIIFSNKVLTSIIKIL